MENVREAGYGLIVASTHHDSSNSLSSKVKNTGFPIVVIEEYYSTYLVNEALSELDDPRILASVSAGIKVLIALVALIVAIVCVVVPLLLAFSVWFMRYRRRAYETRNQEVRWRNNSRRQNQDQQARPELIERILRRDSNTQRPLGAKLTQHLPIKTYSSLDKSLSGPESCAVCVYGFMDGDRLRLLPCGHYFHLNCIDEWLINHSDLCPLCKNQVPHGEEGKGEVHTRIHGARGSGGRGGGGGGGGGGDGGRGLLHNSLLSEEDEEGPWGQRTHNRLLGAGHSTRDYGAV